MTVRSRPEAAGFHAGEVAVQRQAGVEAQAARLTPMVARGQLTAGMAAFLSETTFAAMTARDRTGRLWTSPLLGPPGYLESTSPTTLRITAPPPDADPLHDAPSGQPVGLIAMNFLTRRRVRINGALTSSEAGRLTIAVGQAYGNCPQYIRRRSVEALPEGRRVPLYAADTLHSSDIRLIEAADTFFLGTTHATAGNDASHRGGPPGFVHAAAGQLWWPDYPGNNMFNSFGNLAVDSTAALLFLDFRAGAILQLSGTAAVSWDEAANGFDTGRAVKFVPQRVIATSRCCR
jgi:uncharacterized protein